MIVAGKLHTEKPLQRRTRAEPVDYNKGSDSLKLVTSGGGSRLLDETEFDEEEESGPTELARNSYTRGY